MMNTPSSQSPADHRRLSGWKEIAQYLDRGTRTVQRWEKEYGLPIRRLAGRGGRAESVFAYSAELDDWLDSAAAVQARTSGGSDDGGSDLTGADPVEGGATHPAAPDATGDSPPAAERRAGRPGRNWRSAGLVVALVVVLLFAAWHLRGLF